MDSNKLYEALGNEKNEYIINTTTEEIEIEKNNILEELPLSEDNYISLYEKLKNFKYCASAEQISIGCSVSWIPLYNNDNMITLKHGRVAKTYETQDDVNILYFLAGRMFTVRFSEIIIFQKITDQENTILKLIDNI